MRQCTKCGKNPVSNKKHYCDACKGPRCEYLRQRRERLMSDPEFAEKYRKRELSRLKEDPRNRLIYAAKVRSKAGGVPFALSKEDIQVPSHCPALGIPLFQCEGRHGDNSPSLDRIDPKRGYVKGNVAVISYKANRIKQDATPEELERIAAWLRGVVAAT